jgi:hypothetical protein
MISVQDMVHIADSKTTKRFGDYFIRHISKACDFLSPGVPFRYLCRFDIAGWFTVNGLLLYPQMGSEVGHLTTWLSIQLCTEEGKGVKYFFEMHLFRLT